MAKGGKDKERIIPPSRKDVHAAGKELRAGSGQAAG
jgi:hypothetical protein